MMGGCRCCFRQCPVATARNKGIHFFHFPYQQPERFQKWLKLAGVEHFSKLPKHEILNKVICARHFPDDHFMNYQNNRVTKLSTPILQRLNEEYALDYSKDASSPTLMKIPAITQAHLKAPEGFPNTMRFTAEDRKIAEDTIKALKEGTKPGISEVTSTKRKASYVDNAQESKKPKTIEARRSTIDNFVIFVGDEENVPNASSNEDDPEIESSLVQILATDDEADYKQTSKTGLTETSMQEKSHVVDIPNDGILESEGESLGGDQTETIIELNAIKEKLCKSDENISTLNENLQRLTADNESLKRQLETSEIQFKEIKDELIYLNTSYDKLQREHSELQKQCSALKKQQQQEHVSSTAQQQKPAQQTLTKLQLFNGIKKYLSQTMVALLRIQLSSGSEERVWKSDERRLAVDLLGLGEQVYKFFTEEWILRLPPLRQVQMWRNDCAAFDEEADI